MKINVGVLGSGNIAREHIKVFKDIKEFEIVGVVGRGKKNINKTKKNYSKLIFFKSLKELFNNVKIDLLVICINEDLIIKNYKEILKYNCIFLFEKPLGINYSETKKIYQYSRNKKIFISLNRRFYCSTILALKLFKKIKNNNPKTIFINDSQDIQRIKKMGLSKKLSENLMYTNSIHLVDYINIFIREKILTIKNIIKFKKKKPKDVLSYIKFSKNSNAIYKANWSENERWLINIYSKKLNVNFKPLEKLKIIFPENIKIKKNYDIKDRIYKPGLFNQAVEILELFKNKKNNLVTFGDYLKSVEIVKKIYNY